MKGIDLEYLSGNRHGKNLLKLMTTLALEGPMNMYELSKVSKFSYALVHKSIKELAKEGFLYDHGVRHIERRPGKEKSKYKHETTVWGLSFSGLWTLILSDKNILEKWSTIKEKNGNLGFSETTEEENDNFSFLDYFDFMFKLGVVKDEYGYSTRHNYPNEKMCAQALIYVAVANEKSVEQIYNNAVELLKDYPRGKIIKIFWALQHELAQLEKTENRCKLLLEKFKPLRFSGETENGEAAISS